MELKENDGRAARRSHFRRIVALSAACLTAFLVVAYFLGADEPFRQRVRHKQRLSRTPANAPHDVRVKGRDDSRSGHDVAERALGGRGLILSDSGSGNGEGDDRKKAADAAANKRAEVDMVRAEPLGLGADQAVANDAEEGEGRLIIFEVANLDDGGSGGSTFGQFVVQTRPSWAPVGVQRFEELVKEHFYDGCRIFRVVPKFIVQFGINGDPKVQKKWRGKTIKDDPVVETNRRGTLTFAMSGKNSRTVQLFINTGKGNAYLDKQGFSPIAEVVSGMDFVDKIYSDYREKPNQGMIQNRGNEYLNTEFPRLSFFKKVAFQ